MKRHSVLALMLMLASFVLFSGSASACDQSIPSGATCIHGTASGNLLGYWLTIGGISFGPGDWQGNAVLCSDWDTNCDYPQQTIYSFAPTGSGSSKFEFLGPASTPYRVAVKYPSGGVYSWYGTTSYFLSTTSAGQTYYYSFFAACTDYGHSIGAC